MPQPPRLAEVPVTSYFPRATADRIAELSASMGLSRAAWVRMSVLATLRAHDDDAVEVSR